MVTLDGRHRCSTDASHARRDVLVGLRALEIEILDVEGTHPAVRPRAYGQAGTSSEDPSMRLAMPCDRPNAWPNGLVREMLPDPLREWLDRQDEGERRGALRTLRRVDRESGWADAVGAMPTTLESTGGADGAGVALLAARLAEGVDRVEYDDGRSGLGEYDIAFATKDEEGAE